VSAFPYRGFDAGAHELSVNIRSTNDVLFVSSLAAGGLSGIQFDLTPTRLFADATLEGGPGLFVLQLEEGGLAPFRLNSISADPDDPYAARFSFDTLPDNSVNGGDPGPLAVPEGGSWLLWLVPVALGVIGLRLRHT